MTPWTAAHQASLFFTISWSLLKLMSIESVMPSNQLILCHPLLLLLPIFPGIRIFSSELAVHIMWPKYWSFSFNVSPSKEQPGLISFRIYGFDPRVRKIPWRRAWQPTPVFLPGESLWTEEPGGLQSVGLQSLTRLSD